MLGNQDMLGFNAGVITLHVSHRTATFLARVLAIEYHTVEPSSSIPPGPQPIIGQWAPSDQYALALALQNYRDAAEGFYEVPQQWWNSYDDPLAPPAPAGTDPAHVLEDAGGAETEFERGLREVTEPRLRIHLVASSKYDREWTEWFRLEEEVWAEAARLASEHGVEGTGIELMPGRETARRAGEAWWREPKNGIENMVFNGI